MGFDEAVRFTLSWEGGYSTDPSDPGGETNFGISKKSHPAVDIKGLTEDNAIAIYRMDYWDRLGLDRLPDWLAPAVFDAAVNLGAGRAISFLQRAARVFEDGVLGPETLRAVGGMAPRDLLLEYLVRRALHYAQLPDLVLRFGLGWYRRLLSLHQACLVLL